MYDDSLTKVFETALGIHTPWTIDNTEFVSNDKKLGRLELHVYIYHFQKALSLPVLSVERNIQAMTQEREFGDISTSSNIDATFMPPFQGYNAQSME